MSLDDPLHFPYRNELAMPVVGLEAEFELIVDGRPTPPESLWRSPDEFITRPLLRRTAKASQLPTGGAVYFDGGVLEVVTPVIELGPQATARVVRSLWEQIGFIRTQLDAWEQRMARSVSLRAFSCHANISFELDRDDRSRDRTIQKLAVLLATLLPPAIVVTGANRRSTGIGVRPRRDRIEMTMDFTPDPGLMAACIAMITGIARGVIAWPSYRLDEIDRRGLPRLAALHPGKHPTRKGWIARAEHFGRSPFTASIDADEWQLADGRMTSLRRVALETAIYFREAIRSVSDPFSMRVLFAVLRGEVHSLLDLPDRPAAYDDVGRTTRWGAVLPELENFAAIADGEHEAPSRRASDLEEHLAPPWRGEAQGRRERVTLPARNERRHALDRRAAPRPAPSPRLSRSAYERIFIRLGSGQRVRLEGELLTPVAMDGWYRVVLRDRRGAERSVSIDQLLDEAEGWRA